MASARFRQLERRLKKLRKCFLPAQFSPVGNYTERQLDHARGYRLLVHAEIESYLEDRCKGVASEALSRFRTEGKTSLVLVNLTSFHLVQSELTEKRIKHLYAHKETHCDTATTKAVSLYHRTLVRNNGIRETDFLRMMLPLGLHPNAIDSALVSTLDTFGVNRGEVAHTSIKAQQEINPQDELKTSTELLQGLEKLDEMIEKLK